MIFIDKNVIRPSVPDCRPKQDEKLFFKFAWPNL